MDIFILLLIMVIFYVGPAILKHYHAQQDAQSALAERLNTEMLNTPPKINKEVYIASDNEVHSTMVVEKLQSAPTVVEEQSVWRGKLNQNMIINGVIFAEILKPPRGYRPFVKR